MIVDACRRLDFFTALADYEYVGFGGIQFVDFELVRRELGINRMISIEADSYRADRYSFNRPFAGISMRYGRAFDVLPELLDDVVPRVVWLDYESGLNHEVLQDVSTSVTRLALGSVLVITVNAHPARLHQRYDQLVNDVGLDRLPAGLRESDLGKWGLAAVQYGVLAAEVAPALDRRTDGGVFRQLFHFHHSDGAYMLTWGGLIVGSSEADEWFEKLVGIEQVRPGGDPLAIHVPVLTAKEVIHLNGQLPGGLDVSGHGIPDDDRDAYVRLYRWYPPVPTPI